MTKEMKTHFDDRTKMHIKLVQKYMGKIINIDKQFQALKKRMSKHDASKFRGTEYIPYVSITWMYKCQRDGVEWEIPDEMKDKATKATIHHMLSNKHHPEYWDENFDADEMFNAKNRDGVPRKMVDGTEMEPLSIAEMIADWCAVSEERGTNPNDWLNANVNKRWKFTDLQVKFMKTLLKKIWE